MKQDALEQLVLKYSDSLRSHQLPSLREREADRAGLAGDTDHLAGHEGWALDGKAFLLLARNHDEALRQLLLEETTKHERLVMLAALVRRSLFPLVGLPGRAIFQVPNLISPLQQQDDTEEIVDTLEHSSRSEEIAELQDSPVRRRPPDRDRILHMEKQTKQRLELGVSLGSIGEMSVDEIQMLSHHMGSSKRVVGLCGGVLRPRTADSGPASGGHRQSFVLANRTGDEGSL